MTTLFLVNIFLYFQKLKNYQDNIFKHWIVFYKKVSSFHTRISFREKLIRNLLSNIRHR